MNKIEIIERTSKIALEIIKFTMQLPLNYIGKIFGQQLLKSGTSIGANYRSDCRAQSYTHFISKISIVLEEADETIYWLDLIKKSGVIKNENISLLLKEANELTAIFSSITKTAKNRLQKSKIKMPTFKS